MRESLYNTVKVTVKSFLTEKTFYGFSTQPFILIVIANEKRYAAFKLKVLAEANVQMAISIYRKNFYWVAMKKQNGEVEKVLKVEVITIASIITGELDCTLNCDFLLKICLWIRSSVQEQRSYFNILHSTVCERV